MCVVERYEQKDQPRRHVSRHNDSATHKTPADARFNKIWKRDYFAGVICSQPQQHIHSALIIVN